MKSIALPHGSDCLKEPYREISPSLSSASAKGQESVTVRTQP